MLVENRFAIEPESEWEMLVISVQIQRNMFSISNIREESPILSAQPFKKELVGGHVNRYRPPLKNVTYTSHH